MTIRAKYEDGVFKPLEDVTLNAGTVVEVCVPTNSGVRKRKPESVRDFAFFGLWKDRTDMSDSVEYINKLRRDLRA
ncbi:MAG TPA: antitoxin family protein [Bryobacteraceae bacterium]|nr:antitoxin family protein [Bryobacteraceae bacterium]